MPVRVCLALAEDSDVRCSTAVTLYLRRVRGDRL